MFRLGRVVVVVTLLALLIGLTAGIRTPAQENVIKIGAIYPLSGPLATTGEILREAIELAVDYINNYHPEFAQQGIYFPIAEWEGIPTLSGAKIEVIFKDHRGEPDRGADLAKSLILDDKVVGILGCYNSSVTKTVSTVCERYGIPMINAASTSPALTERGYKWFFRTTPHDRWFVRDLFEFLEGLTEGKVRGVDAVPKEEIDDLAVAVENTEWGMSNIPLFEEFAGKYGYNIVEEVSYPHESPDLTSEVDKLLAANPDGLLFVSYVSDAILFMKTLKERKAAPKFIWGQDAGFEIPDFLKLGPDIEGVLSRTLFSSKLMAVKPVAAIVNEEFKKRTGVDLSGSSARAFTGMQAWAYVLAKAGSTEPDALRRTAERIIIPGDELVVPWKGINYECTETETNQNTWGSGLIIQYQTDKAVPEIIYPFDLTTADMIYPFRAWAD